MTFGYFPPPAGIEPGPYFTPDILPISFQRKFAAAYLSEISKSKKDANTAMVEEGSQALDTFLFELQKWSYFGMVKIGLITMALMMHNHWCVGRPEKRPLMKGTNIH